MCGVRPAITYFRVIDECGIMIITSLQQDMSYLSIRRFIMGNVISSLFNDKLFYEQAFKPNVKHKMRTLAPNEKIIQQNEKHNFLCFIKKGNIHVVVNEMLLDKYPIHTVIASLSQNDIFGEFCLFHDFPASADVVAATESEIVIIDVKSFKAFLESDIQLGYKVYQEMLQMMVKRLYHSNDTVMHLMKSAIDFQKKLHQVIQEK